MNIMNFMLGFVLGVGLGCGFYLYLIARDKNLIHIHDDEMVVKRPHPSMVLVQVSPNVARRLINYQGELQPPNPTEARALHPERTSLGFLKKSIDEAT